MGLNKRIPQHISVAFSFLVGLARRIHQRFPTWPGSGNDNWPQSDNDNWPQSSGEEWEE